MEIEKNVDEIVRETGQASGRHALWLAILAPAVALFVGLIAISVYASTPLTIAGYADFPYGDTITAEPTALMSQSKVWWNDGYWWGVLYNVEGGEYRIYQLDAAQQEWVDTGVPVDPREESRADVLWDEATQKLYVASHYKRENPSEPLGSQDNWAWLYRYSYDANSDSYSLDEDFPVYDVNPYRSESLVLDKDSTGRLWTTWVGRISTDTYKVYVSYTLGDDLTWSDPYELPFPDEGTVAVDDVSALVAFSDDEGGKIGVLWSNQLAANQADRRFHFATHSDTDDPQSGWTLDSNFAAAVTVPGDDHMNFATTQNGELFMVIKTGIDPNVQVDESLIGLVTRETDGTTSFIEISVGASLDTRPIVVVNESTSEVYVFTVNKPDGEAICRFSAPITSPLSNIQFVADNCSPPEGEPPDSPAALAGLVDAEVFIGDTSTYTMTSNPSSTKQRVTDESGVLVIGSDEATNYYVHNLKDQTPPDPEQTATPTGTVEPTATVTGTVEPTPTGTIEPTPTGTVEPTATATSGPPPDADVYIYLPYFSGP